MSPTAQPGDAEAPPQLTGWGHGALHLWDGDNEPLGLWDGDTEPPGSWDGDTEAPT